MRVRRRPGEIPTTLFARKLLEELDVGKVARLAFARGRRLGGDDCAGHVELQASGA